MKDEFTSPTSNSKWPGASWRRGFITLAALVTSTFLSAQTYRTWDNGHASDDWSQRNNWSSNNTPGGSTEIARFSNGNASTTSIDINRNQRTGGMLFDANLTVDITFTRTSSELSIRNGAYGIINNSDQTITFENQMGIENNMTWMTTNVNGGGFNFDTEIDTDGRDLTLEATNALNFINVAGNIIDSGDIIKTGLGTLTLSGTNTYSGDTTVSAGSAILEADNALGTGNTTVESGATLALSDGIDVSQTAYSLAGTGDNDAGAIQNISGDNSLTGTFNLTAATTINSDGGSLSIGTDAGYNNFANQRFNNNGFDITFGGTGETTLYAGLTGSGDLIKNDSGTLIIEGTVNPSTTTTFTGETKVNDGELVLATLFNGAPGSGGLDDYFIYNDITVGDGIGSAGSATLTFGNNESGAGNDYANIPDSGVNVTVNSDGALNTQGHSQYFQDLTFDGGSVTADNSGGTGNDLFITRDIFSTNTSQSATLSGNVNFNADATKIIDVATDSILEISADVENGSFQKTGGGTLILSDNTKDLGSATVSGGNLILSSSNILVDTMDINVDGTGTFTVNSGINDAIDQLTVSSSGALDIDGILTLNGGTISGGSGIDSTGEMILTAGNTLEIASNFTFGNIGTGDGTLTLGDNATLLLSGESTINLGSLNIAGDSFLDFTGGEANTLNLGDLTFESGATLTVNGWSRFSDLWTTQNLDGATLDVRDANTAKITFNGFANTDTIWVTDDFGAKEISVPEPSSYGAIFMAFGLASWLLRRKPRS